MCVFGKYISFIKVIEQKLTYIMLVIVLKGCSLSYASNPVWRIALEIARWQCHMHNFNSYLILQTRTRQTVTSIDVNAVRIAQAVVSNLVEKSCNSTTQWSRWWDMCGQSFTFYKMLGKTNRLSIVRKAFKTTRDHAYYIHMYSDLNTRYHRQEL